MEKNELPVVATSGDLERVSVPPVPQQQRTYADGLLGPVLEELSEAVRDEVAAAKKNPLRHFWVFDGEPVWQNDSGTLVQFRCEVALPILPESPIELLRDGEPPIDGTLVSIEQFEILVFLNADIDEPIPQARLSSKPWFIYGALLNKLEGLQQAPEGDLTVPLAILGRGPCGTAADSDLATRAANQLRALDDQALHPNAAQEVAMAKVLGSRVHYVWGPPGTGKTAALAQMARGVVGKEGRLLVLAHANVAVDVAALRVADAFEGTPALAEGKILRIGVPQLAEVRARTGLTPESALEVTQPHLVRLRDRLEAERRDLARALRQGGGSERNARLGDQLKEVRAQLADVRRQIDAAIERLIARASVLLATLSRSVIDPRIAGWPADTLFIDEASMAPFPFLAAAAIQPERRRCAIFGDFRQLPPVVLAQSPSAKRYLGRDAFDIAGATSKIDSGEEDDRVSLLDLQYRMAPAIAAVVSSLSYQGRLRSAEGAGKPSGVSPIADPWAGQSVLFVDTSDLGPVCIPDPRAGSYSRANLLQAFLALHLTGELRRGGVAEIALTTPYRAQSRLVNALLGKPRLEEPVRAATIHRFQGSERDVVLVDLTDAPPAKGPSRLTDRDPDLAKRLLNVAMSRARWKLILLGPLDFLLRRASLNGPLREVLGLLQEHGSRWRPQSVELAGARSEELEWLGDWKASARRIAAELDRAESSLVVNWPAGLPATADLVSALRRACSKVGSASKVFTPLPLAREFEETPAEIRLMERQVGFFAQVAADRLIFGGTEAHHLFGMVSGRDSVTAALAFLHPEGEVGLQIDAQAHHVLDSRCGRCPECGDFRRPRPAGAGAWALACRNRRHGELPLDAGELAALVRLLGPRCPECQGSLGLRQRKSGHVWLACENWGRGCRSAAAVRLESLFGGE